VANGWLDEAIGDLTNQTSHNSAEPKRIFCFIFSFLSQIWDLALFAKATNLAKCTASFMLYAVCCTKPKGS